MEFTMQPISYTIEQATKVSGICRTTLFEILKSGSIPRIKIGRRTLIRHVDLMNFVNDNAVSESVS